MTPLECLLGDILTFIMIGIRFGVLVAFDYRFTACLTALSLAQLGT